jgi:GAF domain-containing protein
MNKQEKYDELLPQLAALIEGETEEMSVLANVSAALKEHFGWFWVGFYLDRSGELRLGPFQGSVACMHIAYDKGVCGAAFSQRKSIVVPDVELFPGHIACSSLSRSEIVVPIYGHNGHGLSRTDVYNSKLYSPNRLAVRRIFVSLHPTKMILYDGIQ